MAKKILFVLIIAVGIFLRLYQINSLPAGFFIDEVAMAVDAKTLVEQGTDQYGRSYPFAFEDLTDYKLPGYVYAAAVGYGLFGNELASIRLPAITASIASIFLLWYLTRTLFPSKREAPYYAAAALALCYYHIQFGRIAYETMLANAFLIVYLTALVRTIRDRYSNLWFVIGGISLIVCMWTYPAVRFIIPVFTLVLVATSFMLKPNGIKKRNLLASGGFFLTLSALTFIPSFLNRNLDKRPMSYILIDSQGTWYEILVDKTFRTISAWFRMFNFDYLFSLGDTFAFRHGTRETGLYPPVFAIPFIFGIWYYVRLFSKKSFPFLFLGLLIVVIGIPSALTSDTPYGPRLLSITIPFSILIALGAEQIVASLQKKKPFIRKAVYAIFFLVLIYQVGYFAHVYFVHYKVRSLPEFPKATTTLGRVIAEERAENPETTIYFLNGKSCRQWSHDDLHAWYFGNLPNKEMVRWNNLFREVRYEAEGSPFDAYDNSEQPRFMFRNFIMNASDEEIRSARKGSLIIRCGIKLEHVQNTDEKIEQILYMYEQTQQDPYYVVSRKE